MDPQEIESIIEDTLTVAHQEDSRCDEAEHRWWMRTILQDLPKHDDGLVVELGAYAGAGTTSLAMAASLRGWKTISVDLWKSDNEQRFEEPEGGHLLLRYLRQIRRAGLRDWTIQMVGDTRRVGKLMTRPNGPCFEKQERVVFIHIDACHEWPMPAEDWRVWSPMVVPGGVVAFHDAIKSDIPRCIDELRISGDMDGWEEIQGFPPMEYKPGPFWDIGWRTRAFRKM